MGSLEKRLGKLEARSAPSVAAGTRSRLFERLLRLIENAKREKQGCEPLPDLPYTQEDREDDERALEVTIPYYRDYWKTREGQAILDRWEREARERINRKNGA